MLNCPYCEYTARRNSGMSMHVSRIHPDKWKGKLKDSYPEGFDPGTQEPQRKHAGKTKLTEEQKIIRRKQQKNWYDKHKRKKSVKPALPLGQINYCPNCGFNLEFLLVAMGMAQRVTKTLAHETGRHS